MIKLTEEQLTTFKEDCEALISAAHEAWDDGEREWHTNDMFAIGLAHAYIELYKRIFYDDDAIH